jgi:hypothetical protein
MPARRPSTPLAAVAEVDSGSQVGATSVERVLAPESSADVSFSGEEVQRQKSDFVKMREHLAVQPKVRIKLQEDTFVQLNGYSFWIQKKTWVEVPQQVADVLEEAGRI